MAGKDTELQRTAQSPSVGISVSNYGKVTATLTAYRDKVGGGTERITINFDSLDEFELACIGRSAIRALRQLRATRDRLIVERIENATGWREGDGPREG